MRAVIAAAIVAASIATVVDAQETIPTPRVERWRFRQRDVAPDFGEAPIVARAEANRDSVLVLADGRVSFRLERTIATCTWSRTFFEYWMTRLPDTALEEVRRAAATPTSVGLDEILGLVRFPIQLREKNAGGMVEPISWWHDRHQESDGSWSPVDPDWHLDGTTDRCTSLGKESFRVAATALFALAYSNEGISIRPREASRRAIEFLLARQHADGRFANPQEPESGLTHASAALALCRYLVTNRTVLPGQRLEHVTRQANLAIATLSKEQKADGGFGDDRNQARRLSVAVWSVLALKATATAGIAFDATAANRALTWIETTVGGIERGPVALRDPVVLARARAARAAARAALGAPRPALTREVLELIPKTGEGMDAMRDAETIMFGTLVAILCGGEVWDAWVPVFQNVLSSRERKGCARGSWTIPSIWSDAAGRVGSTALMSWALQLYYRYPKAMWLD